MVSIFSKQLNPLLYTCHKNLNSKISLLHALLIPQRFPRLQHVLYPFERFVFSA